MFLSLADTHPLVDAADTPAHCWCFWHDRCTAPAAGAVGLGTRTRRTKFSQMVLAALSASRLPQRPTHTTSEHRNRRDREGIDGVSGHQLSSDIICSQTTGIIYNNISHQQ
ncbi:trans-sialidase [Trypanosoma cruzi]|nr:trans-sialidase [Trypanosoma cruzi]